MLRTQLFTRALWNASAGVKKNLGRPDKVDHSNVIANVKAYLVDNSTMTCMTRKIKGELVKVRGFRVVGP